MDSESDTIPEGSFRDGDQEVYISLYHVQQDTLGVLTPTLVLTENMTMIDVLDNLIGSASDLPDPTKTITKNIDQINSDLTNKADRSELPEHITTAITLDPSNISSGVRIDSLYEKTVGNVIALSMDFTTSVVKTAFSTLFTITDAVPIPTTYYLFMLESAHTGKPVYFAIDGAGHIKNLEELPTDRYLGTFVYVTT
jgi:hypothetical protein